MGKAAGVETIRTAIIDIGSNSIRLVVYAGARRAPAVVFNEKVMAGLGKSLSDDGRIDDKAFTRGIAALHRFATLCEEMRIDSVTCVATAAVREAGNGGEFIVAANRLGLDVRVLSGDDEAEISGLGVLSSIPNAGGIVADLGGGSLELVRVAKGKIGRKSSLPFGVLRIAEIRRHGTKELERRVKAALAKEGWTRQDRGLPLYLVGGSLRSLARVDMTLNKHPLPVMHHHEITLDSGTRLARVLAHLGTDKLAKIPGLSFSRIPTLGDAAALLSILVRQLDTARLIVSSSGLREGLLYQDLPKSVRKQDPLLAAVETHGARYARFSANGRLLNDWIEPMFTGESTLAHKLRLAACLLSDVAWSANPSFRAEHGLEAALHGNWGGIDITGRVVMGQALYSCYSGSTKPFKGIPITVPDDDIRQAIRWGLAMRLAQRLSGGISDILRHSRLELTQDAVVLALPRHLTGLYGEAVERRQRQFADTMNLAYAMRVIDA